MSNSAMSQLLVEKLGEIRSLDGSIKDMIERYFADPCATAISSPMENLALPTSNVNVNALSKLINCRYSIVCLGLHYCRLFYPSVFARSTLLYLQVLSDCTFASSHYTTRKGAPSYLLLVTVSGEGEVEYQGSKATVGRNDILFLDCMSSHTYRAVSGQPWRYKIIHFNGVTLPNYYALFRLNQKYIFRFAEDSKIYNDIDRLFVANDVLSASCEFESHELLTAILSQLSRSLPEFLENQIPESILDIKEWIMSNLQENITLDMLSEKFYISKYSLCRKFKQYTGETLFDFVTSSRINRSKSLLSETSLSVEAIAETCGFSQAVSFYKAFKRQTGMSPSEYRRVFSPLSLQ